MVGSAINTKARWSKARDSQQKRISKKATGDASFKVARFHKELDMRRNWDVVREILLYIANHGTFDVDENNLMGDVVKKYKITHKEAWYHLELLCKEDYVCAIVQTNSTGGKIFTCGPLGGLTWKGQDLLEDISEPNRWEKTKELMEKIGGGGVETLNIAIKEVVKMATKTAVESFSD